MKTPLNYTGNKSRLTKEFHEKFPNDIGVFVDLFCGGGAVGLSANAKKVIFIDNNKNVIALLEHLAKHKYSVLLNRLENLINYYQLSYSAKNGYATYRAGFKKFDNNGLKKFNLDRFYELRKDYNLSKNKFAKKSLDMLYLLLVYGFNNDLRFNKNGEYNLPVGKTDLNKSNLIKLDNYIKRVNEIQCEFICADFRSNTTKEILFSADFVYADPPYLLGWAVYNENGYWTTETENDLIKIMDNLHTMRKNFALSNVIEKQNPKRRNEVLNKWVSDNHDFQILDIDYHYRSSSYNKKNRNSEEREILIVNF